MLGSSPVGGRATGAGGGSGGGATATTVGRHPASRNQNAKKATAVAEPRRCRTGNIVPLLSRSGDKRHRAEPPRSPEVGVAQAAWHHWAMKTLLSFAFLLALPVTASAADIAPPPGFVEGCTIASYCKADEVGDLCSAWHGEADACKTKHASDGYSFRCKTRGASVWSEVWCAPKAAKPPAPPPVKTGSAPTTRTR